MKNNSFRMSIRLAGFTVLLIALLSFHINPSDCQSDRFREDYTGSEKFSTALQSSQGEEVFQDWKILDDAGIRPVVELLQYIPEDDVAQFLEDASTNMSLAKDFNSDKSLTKAWVALDGHNLRLDNTALIFVLDYLDNQSVSSSSFKSSFNASLSETQAIEYIAEKRVEHLLNQEIDDLSSLGGSIHGYKSSMLARASGFGSSPYCPQITAGFNSQGQDVFVLSSTINPNYSSSRLRTSLNSQISAPTDHQAHHIIPGNVFNNANVVLFKEVNRRLTTNSSLYNIDGANNGIYLPANDGARTGQSNDYICSDESSCPLHYSSHNKYDKVIKDLADDLVRKASLNETSIQNISDQELLNYMSELIIKG